MRLSILESAVAEPTPHHQALASVRFEQADGEGGSNGPPRDHGGLDALVWIGADEQLASMGGRVAAAEWMADSNAHGAPRYFNGAAA